MRNLFTYAFLAVAVPAASQQGFNNSPDEDCSMVWVTVYGTAPSGSATVEQPVASTDAASGKSSSKTSMTAKIGAVKGDNANAAEAVSTASSTSSSTSASDIAAPTAATTGSLSSNGSNRPSALNLPTRPDGSAPLPINGNHLSAPVATNPIPPGAATYTPSTPGVFDCADFANWTEKQKTGNTLPSKWMKIAPGHYRYKPGPLMQAGTDANTVKGENLVLYNFPPGWTLDIRGVTFIIDITDENKYQRPSVMIYVIQAESMTILGGTIWIDQGELFTQARVVSIGAPDSGGNGMLATMEVEQGYNVSAWKSAGPRNQRCIDDSNPDHFITPGCNFWYVSNYNFDNLESNRTFTAVLSSRAAIKKGYVLTMENVINSYIAVSTEDNSGTHVKGLTSNGNMMSIGLHSDQVAPTFENVYYVNPPPRPGYATRVEGPALSWGNIGGFVYNTPGQVPAKMPGSFWQYTGCVEDLQVGSNNTAPDS